MLIKAVYVKYYRRASTIIILSQDSLEIITSLFLTVRILHDHYRSQSLSLSWIQSLTNCTHACRRPDKYSKLMIITNCPQVYAVLLLYSYCTIHKNYSQ